MLESVILLVASLCAEIEVAGRFIGFFLRVHLDFR
jgi:hypothetical protein